MRRKIINIDEKKCNGCAQCIPNCPEGAIQIIDGKARLVGELLCDGLGACIGNCPLGAISIEEREAAVYDEIKVLQNILKAKGSVLQAHLKHLYEHGQTEYLNTALSFLKDNAISVPEYMKAEKATAMNGCPGSQALSFEQKDSSGEDFPEAVSSSVSRLSHWPIQLHLISPSAPYFKNAALVIAADCVPFTCADFHNRFLKDKKLIIFCPKLDHATEDYIAKLTELITLNSLQSITLVHMEVPCCNGIVSVTDEAVRPSGKNVIIKEYTISLRGEIL
jgi:NAD-dependent dihydropyrimidine dehydrogenase PreA subunit